MPLGLKNVMLLTTTIPILGRTIDDGKEKPAVFKGYDYLMLGVDRCDQLGMSKTVRIKSARWPMSVGT